MEVGFEQEAAEGAECSFFSGFSPPGRAFFGGTSGTSVTTRMNIGFSCHRKRHTEASQASHPTHSWEKGMLGVLEWWLGEGKHRRARRDAPYPVPSSLGNWIWSPGFLPPGSGYFKRHKRHKRHNPHEHWAFLPSEASQRSVTKRHIRHILGRSEGWSGGVWNGERKHRRTRSDAPYLVAVQRRIARLELADSLSIRDRECLQESVEGACEIPQFIAFGEPGIGSEGTGIYTQPAQPVAEPGGGDGGVPQPVRQHSQGVHELFGGYAS